MRNIIFWTALLSYGQNKVVSYSRRALDVDVSSEENDSASNYETATNTYGSDKDSGENDKKPCSIVVLSSNIQNPNMQSLLRKYRYDANGMLIPSSVKYFIKMPQGLHSPPILVPLNDRAFSPLGGFVRYYKVVPPIPRSW